MACRDQQSWFFTGRGEAAFLDEILTFQHGRSVDVRKAIVGFMEAW